MAVTISVPAAVIANFIGECAVSLSAIRVTNSRIDMT